jgi:fatty acid desaturase
MKSAPSIAVDAVHTRERARAHEVPELLNWTLLCASIVVTSACLWLASHGPWWLALLAACAFAFVNQAPFSLMHEAVHGVAAATPRRNRALGLVAGWMFPTALTLQENAHLGHHARNRTDQDLYDYHLPGQSRRLRNLWLYAGNLLGLYWFLIPLSNLFFLLTPPLYRSRVFVERVAPKLGFGPYARDAARLPAGRLWLEIAAAFGFQAGRWWLLDLSWQGWLLAHFAFALHWSSFQYVDHAWSPRDVVEGAWDLRVFAPVRWLALNYHYHLAHHRHPGAPWTRLPALATRRGQPSFWQVYRSLWRHGVQPAPPMGAPAGWSLLGASEEEA